MNEIDVWLADHALDAAAVVFCCGLGTAAIGLALRFAQAAVCQKLGTLVGAVGIGLDRKSVV